MKIQPLGFWRRFLAVFTPTFISRLMQDKSADKSWGFWFLSTLILLAIPSVIFSVFAMILLANFPSSTVDFIPAEETSFELPTGEQYDFNTILKEFELTLDENYELQTKNIPDPLIMIINEEDEDTIFVNTIDEIDPSVAEAVFVIDTKNRLVTLDDSENFSDVLFLLHNKFIMKSSDEGKTEIVTYKDLFEGNDVINSPLPFTFNLASLSEASGVITQVFFMVFLFLLGFAYVFLAGFRLVSALFWALVFWALGAIVGIKKWDFEKSFMAMLHFSFVTLLLFPLGIILGLSFFWSAFVILVLLFGANFYEIKRHA